MKTDWLSEIKARLLEAQQESHAPDFGQLAAIADDYLEDVAHLLAAIEAKDIVLKEISSIGFWHDSKREDLIEAIRYMRDLAKNIIAFDPTLAPQEEKTGTDLAEK